MMELAIGKVGIIDTATDQLVLPWNEIKGEFPEFIKDSNDEEVFYKAAHQYRKSGKLYHMIFPHLIEKCPFCSIEFKAELKLRLIDRTFNYCPNCGKNIADIFKSWRSNVTIKGEE